MTFKSTMDAVGHVQNQHFGGLTYTISLVWLTFHWFGLQCCVVYSFHGGRSRNFDDVTYIWPCKSRKIIFCIIWNVWDQQYVRHTFHVPLEYRLCQLCDDEMLEDEFHFILYCDGLKEVRSQCFEGTTYLEDVEDPTDKVELCKLMFNSHNLKHSAKFMERMFDARTRMLWK